jgi:hypothetical protein
MLFLLRCTITLAACGHTPLQRGRELSVSACTQSFQDDLNLSGAISVYRTVYAMFL